MSEFNREQLRKHFREGALPTGEHYAALIDSMVNKRDDGFKKDPQGGLRISSLGAEEGLLSFAKGAGAEVSWCLRHTNEMDLTLAPPFSNEPDAAEQPNVTLTRSGPVGINREDPVYTLDIGGPVRSSGRIGDVLQLENDDAARPIVADGNWHSITPILSGCHALEVIAGVGGKRGKGRYALLHAIALNTYNPSNNLLKWLFGFRPIRQQTAVFGRYSQRLRLRWLNVGKREYKLQIKTSSSYNVGDKRDTDPYRIRYGITRLWYDEHMEGSRQSDDFLPENSGL